MLYVNLNPIPQHYVSNIYVTCSWSPLIFTVIQHAIKISILSMEASIISGFVPL